MAAVSVPYSPAAARASLLGLDWPMLILTLFLAIWGAFTVVSATKPTQTPVARVSPSIPRTAPVEHSRIPDSTKQIAFVVIGVAAILALSLVDYRWLMHLQGWIYAFNLLCLLAVLVLPSSIAP